MIAVEDRIEKLLSRVNVLTKQVERSLAGLVEENAEDVPNFNTLRDYQLYGVHWMTALHGHNLHGIIADEMGLGKTLQIISFLMLLAVKYDNYGPHMMVGPLSVLSTWASEIEKFSDGEFNLHVYYGDKEERENYIDAYVEQSNRCKRKKSQRQQPKQISIILTTYSLAINDISVLRTICHRLDRAENIEYLIVDEAHRIKRQSCILHQRLRTIPSKHRILLTGTPLQNNVQELWSLLRFLNPEVFTAGEEEILEWFNRPFADNQHPSSSSASTLLEKNSPLKNSETRLFQSKFSYPSQQQQFAPASSQIIINQLQKILLPFMLRRLKQDVAVDIPSKAVRVIKCPLTPLQQELTQILRQMVQRKVALNNQQRLQQRQSSSIPRSLTQLKLDAFDDDESLSSVRLGKAFILLRKLCNHPFLVLDEFLHVADTTQLLTVSGKLLVLHAILQPLLQQGSKVLVFSQMTSTLDIIEEYLSMEKIACFRIDGLTTQAQRQTSINEFSQRTSQVHVFLLTTPAGGVGINLQVADVVILFDQDWNPQQDLQAIGRAHRIGQKKAVLVLRLVSVGLDETTYSIEERMLQRAMCKLRAGKQILATTTSIAAAKQQPQVAADENASENDDESSDSEDEQLTYANGDNNADDEKRFPFKWTSLFADKQQPPVTSKATQNSDSLQQKYTASLSGSTPCCRAIHSITLDLNSEGQCMFNNSDLDAVCQRINSNASVQWQDDDYAEVIVHFPPTFLNAEQKLLESTWRPWLEIFRRNMLPIHPLHQTVVMEDVHGPRLRQRTTAVKYNSSGSLMIDPSSKEMLVSESASFLEEDDSEFEMEHLRRSINNKRARRVRHKARSQRLEAQYSSPFSEVYRAKRKKSQPRGAAEVDGSNSSEGRTTLESNEHDNDDDDEDICVLCGQAGLSNEEVAILTRLQSSLSQDSNVLQYDIEGEVDTMILCDGCDGAYHTICVGLQVAPDEDWFCSWCQHHSQMPPPQQQDDEIIVVDLLEEN